MRWLIEIIDNYHNIIITTIIPNNWYSVMYSWSSWFVSIKSIIARLKQHHKQQHRCKTCHGTCPALSATMVTLSSAASSPSENSSSKLYSINPRSILLQKQHHFPKKNQKVNKGTHADIHRLFWCAACICPIYQIAFSTARSGVLMSQNKTKWC